MRHIRPLLLIAFAGCGLARADTVHVFTGSLGGTSDFVFRGLSLTRGKPAAQTSVDIEFPREFYVGAFLAMADPNPGPSPVVEMDFWAGRYWRVAENWSADLRLSQYTYPEDPRRVTYDRTEITGTVGFHNQLFFAAVYSPNTKAVASAPGYERDGNAWALELSGRQPLNEHWSLSAGFGHYDLQEIYHDSYNYWNFTVTATISPFELQLAYLGIDTSVAQHFPHSDVGDRIAVTVLWRFSATN